jgi:hypothetical protein
VVAGGGDDVVDGRDVAVGGLDDAEGDHVGVRADRVGEPVERDGLHLGAGDHPREEVGGELAFGDEDAAAGRE